MARMLPATVHPDTASSAERRIFDLLKDDSATSDWTVLHSLGLSRRGSRPYGEIDFVALIPRWGVLCLEVKGGRVACRNGQWETADRYGRTAHLKRSPFLQARECMFALRDAVMNRAPLGFPADLFYGYAVVLPDVTFDERSPEWESSQVIDRQALARPLSTALLLAVKQQRKLHGDKPPGEPSGATIRTLQQLLRPDFDVVVSRGTTIEDTEAQLLRLTEEQFAALDLLADNERCLFEGAAGTGKTMLAVEYARRSSATGQRTLLVCFNRLLGDWLQRQASGTALVAGSYFKTLREVIVRSSIAEDFVKAEAAGDTHDLFERTYPMSGRLALEELAVPCDVLVLDEAQDLLQPTVLDVLDVWLKGGLAKGRWAIFGDFQRQALFANASSDVLRSTIRRYSPEHTKGRLTFNCRNTRNIGEETALLSGFESLPFRMGQFAGLPVDYRYYRHAATQAAMVRELIGKLVDDGVRPADIVLLSSKKLAHSGLAGLPESGELQIADIGDRDTQRSSSGAPLIRFATIGAFKGMESPVVVLCDVDRVSDREPQSLLYVAMSRARSQLVVFAQDGCRQAISECIRRKLQEGWIPKS